MNKANDLYKNFDPALTSDVEGILSQLGLTAPEAVNLFFRQIVLTGGLPFELKVPRYDYEDFDEEEEAEVCKKLDEGMADIKAGRVKTFDEIKAMMNAEISKYEKG